MNRMPSAKTPRMRKRIPTWFRRGAKAMLHFVGREAGASPAVVEFGVGYVRAMAAAYPAIGTTLVLSMGLAGGGSVRLALGLEAADDAAALRHAESAGRIGNG